VPRPIVLLLALAACAVAPPPPAPAPTALPSAARDFDRDTFTTSFDRCPDVAGVAPDGCPPPDADADGVPDDLDKCADGLETRNGLDDGDGCPDKLPKDLVRITGLIKGIHFATDKDALQPRSNATLARTAAVLKRYPSVRLEIVGQAVACETGKDLQQRRAQSIKQHLVDRGGIDPARLETRGACLDNPVAGPKPAKSQPRNRIEFTILQ
jgi:outer membrane protein OmpA-like peptidoglycan-associated protein